METIQDFKVTEGKNTFNAKVNQVIMGVSVNTITIKKVIRSIAIKKPEFLRIKVSETASGGKTMTMYWIIDGVEHYKPGISDRPEKIKA